MLTDVERRQAFAGDVANSYNDGQPGKSRWAVL
jgi:hypothetical protein